MSSRTSQKLAGDEFIIKKLLDGLKSKLPFKKKLTDEEEDYEIDEEDEQEDLEEIESSNSERTQFVNTSDLEKDSEDESEDDDFEDEDDEEYEDEPGNLKEKIQFQLNQALSKLKFGKKNNEEEVDSSDETQSNIKKPNKNKLLIQIVIVLGLIYFIGEEFLKEEPQVVPQLKPRPDQLARENPPVESVDQDEPDVSNDDVSQDLPPVENGPVISEDIPSVDEGSVVSEDIPIVDEGSIVSEDTSPVEEEPIVSDDTPVVNEEPIVSEDITEPSHGSDLSDQLGANQGEGQNDPFGDLASPIEDTEGDLTEKILQDLESQVKNNNEEAPSEYVSPPDYEYPGRGLVYNCKALHWACVDGPSYKTCEQNASYLKENAKAPECYPFNVYETSKGCSNMQNRMVSSGASTDFCKEF